MGEADDNDHPPLGKLFIAAGMLLFGDNPTGWRAASLIFGLQTLVIAAALARALFADRRAGWFAAAFFAGDGFFLAYSRTALLDGGLTCLVLWSLLAAVTARTWRGVLACAVLVGLAASVKWSGAHGGRAGGGGDPGRCAARRAGRCCSSPPRRSCTSGALARDLSAVRAAGRSARAVDPHARALPPSHRDRQSAEPAGVALVHLAGSLSPDRGQARRPRNRPLLRVQRRQSAAVLLGDPLHRRHHPDRPAAEPFDGAPAPAGGAQPAERAVALLVLGWFALLAPWMLGRGSYVFWYHYLPSYGFAIILLGGLAARAERRSPRAVAIFVGLALLIAVYFAPVRGEFPLSDAIANRRLIFLPWRP